MRSQGEILNALQAHRETIRGFGVRSLSLFGSCARGEATETSDIDFVVEFERKSFDVYMDLKAFLEGLFECRVDLVLEEAIKPRLRSVILEEAVRVQGL